jgi:hypothetical protein
MDFIDAWVAELRADVTRFLTGEPISARRMNYRKRLGSLLERNSNPLAEEVAVDLESAEVKAKRIETPSARKPNRAGWHNGN